MHRISRPLEQRNFSKSRNPPARWARCDFKKFRDGYNKMRSARVGIYIEVILSYFLYLLPQYITRISYFTTYSVTYDWLFVLSALVNGFAFAQCSFQTSWIGTSRRTPSIGIAVANVILYFAVVLDLLCNGTNHILLYPFLDITGASLRENINNIFNSIPDGVKTGVIVATGVALLKDFISQMFASINNQHPGQPYPTTSAYSSPIADPLELYWTCLYLLERKFPR